MNVEEAICSDDAYLSAEADELSWCDAHRERYVEI
jgi:hypothetical protein